MGAGAFLALAPIAYQNKSVVYDLLFRTAVETLLIIGADPKHLGARNGRSRSLPKHGREIRAGSRAAQRLVQIADQILGGFEAH